MKKLFFSILILVNSLTQAGTPNPHPIHEWYGLNAYELIFSFGTVTSYGQSLDNIVRFTPFFNPQGQSHYNFSNHVGLFTGLGVRNIGFLNKISVANEKPAELKQRAYSIGVPLAIKLGNMEYGRYLAVGAEAEYMFNYKQNIYHGGTSKYTAWFSPRVNGFNPSVFADLRFHNGTFLRFRYYLNDFLKNQDSSFFLPDNGELVTYRPEKSQLMYISWGWAFMSKKKHPLNQKDV